MTLAELNALPSEAAEDAFARCCGARAWAVAMAARRPFRDLAELQRAAAECEAGLSPTAWLEAFTHHPRIGDVSAPGSRFAATAAWAAGEQAGAAGASEDALARLMEANRRYEERFGYIFIVCATGKSADEMLAVLERRLANDPERELRVAAEEQAKITRLRLEKLVSDQR